MIFLGTSQTKSFVNTDKALVVFNHFPLASLEVAWTRHEVKMMMMEAKSQHLIFIRLASMLDRCSITDAIVTLMSTKTVRELSSNILSRTPASGSGKMKLSGGVQMCAKD